MRGLSTTFSAGAPVCLRYAPEVMRSWGILTSVHGLAVGAALAAAAACGGTTSVTPAGTDTGSVDSGTPASGGTGPWTWGDAGPVPIVDAGEDVRSDYDEPECPDAAPPPIERWCDPFEPHADCPAGEACYPFVEYPDPNDDCAQERYGTICAPEGYGVQGTPCEAGDCAAGYICVLTGQGTQCLQMCDTYGENTCPPGFFCEQIDIQPGLGGCY